ncbi:protein YsdE [Escherichia coli]|nr:protein YsdE [Escherichia coli]MED7445374.1 protein YsdE [Escherichia coli O157]MED7769346.1 protein YsdE [Escherichia coli]
MTNVSQIYARNGELFSGRICKQKRQ